MFTDHNGIKTEMSNRVWRAGTDRKGTPGVPAGLAGDLVLDLGADQRSMSSL